MGLFGRKLADQERAEELFSPYIDGQVTAEEKQFLERYLADHPEAREKFELLQAAVHMTKTLPLVKAPRSFVLPRSMARKPSLAVRMYPALRFATVAAMALFAFALIGDLTTSSRLQLAAPAPERVLSARSSEVAEPTSPPAAQLFVATPAAMPTATPAPEAGAASPVDATAVAEQPAPPAEQATATADSAGLQLEQAAPTVEASADQSAMKADESESTSGAQQPPLAQVDALRLAVLALAGLAVALGVTTLIIRRRVR
jgi:anti-sigma factor RsiW